MPVFTWETSVLPGRLSSARGLPEVDVLSLHVVPSSQALLVSDVVSVANESPAPPAPRSGPPPPAPSFQMRVFGFCLRHFLSGKSL